MSKLVLILLFSINIIAQDGSDINYVDISELDNTYIGKMAHLDFYGRSFGGLNFEKKDLNDTVVIKLENRKIEFKEHRVDDGFNNWFSKQYLESIKFIDGLKIRITMSQIQSIQSDSINVILFLEYRDRNGRLNSDKPNKIAYRFSKKIMSEILIRN